MNFEMMQKSFSGIFSVFNPTQPHLSPSPCIDHDSQEGFDDEAESQPQESDTENSSYDY